MSVLVYWNIIFIIIIISSYQGYTIGIFASILTIYTIDKRLLYKKQIYITIFIAIALFSRAIIESEALEEKYIEKNISAIAKVVDLKNSDSYIVKTLKTKENSEDTKVKYLIYTRENLEIGDIIELTGKAKASRRYKNQGAFDYNKYLKTRNIKAIIYPRKLKILAKKPNVIDAIRQSYIDEIKETSKYIHESYRGIYQKLLCGKNFADKDSEEKYREAGLAHLLAISGLHIGLLYLMIEEMFIRIKIQRIYRGFVEIGLLFVISFVLIDSITVYRTAIILFIHILGQMFHQRTEFFSSLSVSSFLILFIQPMYIYDVGFQLTFGAMIAIGLYNEKIKPKLNQRIRQKSKNKEVNEIISQLKFIEFLLFPTWIQIFILPIILYHFQEIHIATVLLNIVVVPFFGIAIAFSYILVSLGWIPFAAIILANIINGVFYYNELCIETISNMIALRINVCSLSFESCFCFYAFIMIYLYREDFNLKSRIDLNYQFCEKMKEIFIVGSAVMLFITPLIVNMNAEVNIHIVDVGQGDSVLIEHKGRKIMIDSGGDRRNIGRAFDQNLEPYLYKNGKIPIECWFITHLDYDHYGALSEGIGHIPIRCIVLSPFTSKNKALKSFVSLIDDAGIKHYKAHLNQKIKLSSSVKLEVIGPIKKYADENNNSLVLLLTAYGKRILFTGDMSLDAERDIINDSKLKNIDILKVGHHGSKSSTSKEFLDNINPKIALVSVGENNSYGHPDESVLEKLENRNIKILRTDIDGEIVLTLHPRYCIIETYAQRQGRRENLEMLLYLSYILIIGEMLACTTRNT